MGDGSAFLVSLCVHGELEEESEAHVDDGLVRNSKTHGVLSRFVLGASCDEWSWLNLN